MVISKEVTRVMRTFGKKLSKKEKLLLLEMLQFCDKNSQACSAAVKLVPMRSVLLAVILEREGGYNLWSGTLSLKRKSNNARSTGEALR
jgi:hypothetical protein